MKALSDRESLLVKALDAPNKESMSEALGLGPNGTGFGNFKAGTKVLSVITDAQLLSMNANRAKLEKPLPPLLIDLIEATGVRAGQIIDASSGTLIPNNDFRATFYQWTEAKGFQMIREERGKQTRYYLNPTTTMTTRT